MREESRKETKVRKGRRSGQVIRRGESKWLIRIYRGTDAVGKRDYYNKTIHGAKKDAEKWLAAALRRLDMNEPIEESDLSFGAFFDQWLKTKAQTLKERTRKQYKRLGDLYILPHLSNRPLAAITAGDLQKMFNAINDRSLAGSTVALIRATLSGCLRHAAKLELIRRNPLAAIEPPRIERKRLQAFTADEAQRLLRAAESTEWDAFIAFLLTTGCRPGEAQGLRWEDVNLDAGTVTINHTLYTVKDGAPVLTEPKTKNARRSIPLGDVLPAKLREHRKRQNEMRLAAGSEWRDNRMVFCTVTGEPISSSILDNGFKKVLRLAGLPETFTPKACRHTAATLLMASGLSPKVASERLGHSDVSITLKVYSHVSHGLQKEASETLEKLLFG